MIFWAPGKKTTKTTEYRRIDGRPTGRKWLGIDVVVVLSD